VKTSGVANAVVEPSAKAVAAIRVLIFIVYLQALFW